MKKAFLNIIVSVGTLFFNPCAHSDEIDQGFDAIAHAQENLDKAKEKAQKVQAFSFLNNLQEKQHVSFILMNDNQESNMNVQMHHSCNMNMFIYSNGLIKPSWLGSQNYNQKQLKDYNELVFYHEFSHCEYANMDKFYFPGIQNSKVKQLNEILDVTQREDKRDFISDVARLQMENFADIYGTMIYLKINGITPQTLLTVNLLLQDRQSLTQYWQEKFLDQHLAYTINAYDCSNGIEKVLTNKEIIVQMPPAQLKQLALQWTSENTQSIIKKEQPSFRKHIPYNLDTAIAMQQVYEILKF